MADEPTLAIGGPVYVRAVASVLPSQSNIVTLDFVMYGSPWCKVPAKSAIITTTMDYVKNGIPWVVNPY